MSQVIQIEVTNRKLLLALDNLYRTEMKAFETKCLLPASQYLIEKLSLSPQAFPVEGYYSESEELKTYFLNVKTLQQRSASDAQSLINTEAYQQILSVISSEIYGAKLAWGESFFPQRLNALYFALQTTEPRYWTVETLLQKAHRFAVDDEDISLVGIAAFIQDEVVLAAVRESVALYGAVAAGSGLEPPTYEYLWNVSSAVEEKANRFIEQFNQLTSSKIRRAQAEHAAYFNSAYEDNELIGRCIYIGYDGSQSPIDHYHWAIAYEDNGSEFTIDAFWDTKIWTTTDYQEKKLYDDW